jgi:hypothetical protein
MRTLLAGMVAVATAFAVVLGLGFWIHERTQAIPDSLFGLIAALAIAAIAGVIFCLMQGISPWKDLARKIDRIGARLVNRKPTAHVEHVERRSAAQIAYSENRTRTAACAHLQPIEYAMRMAGLDVSLLERSVYHPVVKAACRINEAELKRVFALPAWVYYKEGYEPERSAWDNPRAGIICAECLKSDRSRCDILVLHPSECREDTPWFPAPPEPVSTPAILPA